MKRAGSEFYTRLANLADNEETRTVLFRLAEEEREHMAAFQKMLDAPGEKTELYDGDALRYLLALLPGDVFAFSRDDDLTAKNVKDALAVGIQAEKDSILLYQELYDLVRSPEVRRTLGRLLQAEKMHLVELRAQMEEL
ncbi:hypothetical protein SY88_05980 [Clostridiales bacterium PH28_bin88]|nr:hypothetical protein SY88_05980 [Clostridiales bacterium PH28_bin88]